MIHPATRKRKHHRRSKAGCLTCRARRKRCTEEKPTCLGCKRNSLICTWLTPAEGAMMVAASHEDASSMPPLVCSDTASTNAELSANVFPQGNHSKDDPIDVAKWPASSPSRPHRSSQSPDLSLRTSDLAGTILYTAMSSLSSVLRRPEAYSLYAHYTDWTAMLLAARPQPGNPYASCLLPIALANDDIMHAVLAISGSHRASSRHDPSFLSLARHHYAVALRSAKHSITRFTSDSQRVDAYTLIALLLTLCQFECVEGDLKGAALCHLNAAHVLFQKLPNAFRDFSETSYGFLFEQYLYLSCVTRNATLSLSEDPPPPIILPPSEPDEDSSEASGIKNFMFGHGYGLYSLIPEIQSLAHKAHFGTPIERHGTISAFEATRQKLELWEPPKSPATPDQDFLWLAASMYRQALYVYLYCAVHGPSKPNLHLFFQIERHIDLFFQALDQMPLYSPEWTTLTWTILTVGSCLRDVRRQDHLIVVFSSTVHQMNANVCTFKVLRWLWNAGPDAAFGPYGLEKIMKLRNVRLSVG